MALCRMLREEIQDNEAGDCINKKSWLVGCLGSVRMSRQPGGGGARMPLSIHHSETLRGLLTQTQAEH